MTNVGSVAFVDQRKDRRIPAKPAVPIEFAVDLDRLHQQRQAGRCQQRDQVELARRSKILTLPVRTLVAHK